MIAPTTEARHDASAVPVVLPPARAPRDTARKRLLLVEASRGSFADKACSELPELLCAGDVLVVNDASTLPASLRVVGEAIEVRLIGRAHPQEFLALAFGAGDYHTDTEARPLPRKFELGELLDFGGLRATVVSVDPTFPRLLRLRLMGDPSEVISGLYRSARPIQYSHLSVDLELWDVQVPFASRPWAFEAPSAGLTLSFDLLDQLRAKGVRVVPLTHAAGISSTGSAALDRRLPLDERYDLPAPTARAIASARAAKRRVIAVGTTVVRALEDNAARHGGLRSGVANASLMLGPGHRLRVVDGLLTGLHEPGTSHFELLQAFADRELLLRAFAHAACQGYRGHEFGDACLIQGETLARHGIVPSP